MQREKSSHNEGVPFLNHQFLALKNYYQTLNIVGKIQKMVSKIEHFLHDVKRNGMTTRIIDQ